MVENDILLSEWQKRIEKIKNKFELEKLKVDEIKELKKDIFTEYEKNKDELEELEEKIDSKEKKFIELQNKELNKYDYILQMEDDSFEVASKSDIEIIDDLKIIKKSLKLPEGKEIALMQIHFTDIDKKKYDELQEKDWCPFVDLMDYGAHCEVRFYNSREDKLIQLQWDIPREDVIKLKNLYVKEESFWMEPNDDNYSYMALIWNGNV